MGAPLILPVIFNPLFQLVMAFEYLAVSVILSPQPSSFVYVCRVDRSFFIAF